MQTSLIIASFLSVGVVLGVPAEVDARRKKSVESPSTASVKIVVYQGKLQDSQGGPISGIFPLTFELHRRARGGRAMWKEKHFVAVDSGSYVVELGRTQKIKGSIDLSKAYLGVSLGSSGELLRERLAASSVKTSPAVGSAPVPNVVPDGNPDAATARDVRTKGDRIIVHYAEEAGEAYVAGQARVAERIGSLTAKDIESAVAKLKNFKGGAALGSTKKFSKSVGGGRGVEFELTCPKGYVVTGISGGAGLYIDSIKLICQPLE